MPVNRSLAHRWALNLALVCGSLCFVFLLLAGAEAVVRAATDVGRLGTQANLFKANAWSTTIGNQPHVSAVAFGVEVHTDQYGFRSPTPGQITTPGNQNVLMLGDSVAFGVGVQYERTAAALVAAARPELTLINAAVIGHDFRDYLNIYTGFTNTSPISIQAVWVVICLNDISHASAVHIRDAVQITRAQPAFHQAGLIPADTVNALRNNQFARALNDYLRAYSSLYVLARGIVTDPRSRDWAEILGRYKQFNTNEIEQIFAPLDALGDQLRKRQIPLHAWIVPHAEQMQDGTTAMPQERLAALLRKHKIAYTDLLEPFRSAPNPSSLFLPFDPVHLSPTGHVMLARFLSAAESTAL